MTEYRQSLNSMTPFHHSNIDLFSLIFPSNHKYAYIIQIIPKSIPLSSHDMLSIEIDEGSKRDLPRSFGIQFPHDHLHFLLAQALLQFCGQVQKVVLADESLAVCVDLPEDPFEVFAGVPLVGSFEDHPEKFLEIYVAALVLVVEGHGLVYPVAFGMVAVVLGHRLKQISRSEDSVLVGIEGVEDFFPDLDVAFCDVVRDELSGLEGLAAGGVAHAGGVHRVSQSGVLHQLN